MHDASAKGREVDPTEAMAPAAATSNERPVPQRNPQTGIFKIGDNCWRMEAATKACVVIDADDYFRHARKAMLEAKHQILLIGWDFDTRITLDRDSDDGAPRQVGPFLSWLAKRRPELKIHILKWDLGAIKLLGRGSTLFRLSRWIFQKHISFRLDGRHPTGAAHHHKILVIDDSLAFCGGIDMTAERWDTREHKDDDKRRRRPTTNRPYGPWHDATMAVSGPAAKALGEHGRMRWKAACGEDLPVPAMREDLWLDDMRANFRDQPFAISRTRGSADEQSPVREIERLFVDMIASAERLVYIESQYFASRVVAQAVIDRLKRPNPPEIVVVNPHSADGWLEEAAMGPARALLVQRIKDETPVDHFRLYSPVTAKGEDIYVHAKIMIVDERIVRVGSANLNNRSMGLDSECDLALCADCTDDASVPATIAALRADLLAEHLGQDAALIETRIKESGSLIGTIESLRGSGRTLVPYEAPEFSELEMEAAKAQLLDPESAGDDFEPAARPGIFSRLRQRNPFRG